MDISSVLCDNFINEANKHSSRVLDSEDNTMAKTLIAFFSRADENYFGGAMRYPYEWNAANKGRVFFGHF